MAEAATASPAIRPLLVEPVGVGCGHDGEGLVRPPGRCEGGIQSAKTGASFACLSQLFHRQPTNGDGRGGAGGESDRGFVCTAGVVDVAGRSGAVESSAVCAWGL